MHTRIVRARPAPGPQLTDHRNATALAPRPSRLAQYLPSSVARKYETIRILLAKSADAGWRDAMTSPVGNLQDLRAHMEPGLKRVERLTFIIENGLEDIFRTPKRALMMTQEDYEDLVARAGYGGGAGDGAAIVAAGGVVSSEAGGDGSNGCTSGIDQREC